MKEGGIIATSFTIYPNEENGREDCVGRRERGARPVAYYFRVRVLIQPQIPVLLTGTSLIPDRKTTACSPVII